MTKYALPAILGGQQLDGEAHGDGVILNVPGYGDLLMPAGYVTEVGAPEDPNGTVWSNGVDVWIRHDIDLGLPDDVGQWWGTVTGQLHGYRRWQEVAPIVAAPGWRRYVPDPADDAPRSCAPSGK